MHVVFESNARQLGTKASVRLRVGLCVRGGCTLRPKMGAVLYIQNGHNNNFNLVARTIEVCAVSGRQRFAIAPRGAACDVWARRVQLGSKARVCLRVGSCVVGCILRPKMDTVWYRKNGNKTNFNLVTHTIEVCAVSGRQRFANAPRGGACGV